MQSRPRPHHDALRNQEIFPNLHDMHSNSLCQGPQKPDFMEIVTLTLFFYL